MNKLNKNDTVYFVKIPPNPEFAEIYDLHIRTVAEDYYVGLDNTTNKHAYVFKEKDINKTIFLDRTDALEKMMELQGEYNSGNN